MVAIIAAALITATGFNAYVMISLIGAILFSAWSVYLKCIETGASKVEHYGAAIKGNSERFRSAFDHSAIGWRSERYRRGRTPARNIWHYFLLLESSPWPSAKCNARLDR